MSTAKLGAHSHEPTVFAISKYDGVVLSNDYHDRRVASVKLDGYKVLEIGGWAYSTIHIDEGSIARNNHDVLGVVSPMYTILKWISEDCAPAYFEYLLRTPEMLTIYKNMAQGSINRRRSLPWRSFSAIEVAVPPLEEQQRIVDLIGSLDDAIEAADAKTQKSQTTLGALAETLTKVETVSLGSLAIMRSGPSWGSDDESDVPRAGFDPVLAITNTRPTGEIDLTGQRFVKGLSEKVMRLTDDSIVMIRTNGNRSRIGNVYRSNSSVLGFAVSAFQIAIEPISSFNSDFLFWVLSMPTKQSLISNSASGSTGLGNVAIGWLKELEVPFPNDASVREEFVSLCKAANDSVLASRSLATSFRTLRAELLTVLLSGEHEIPESYDAATASQLEPAA